MPPEWPGKVIKLVVPFAAGGSTDLIARQIAQDLGERLKTSVVVDNRPGTGGTAGSEYVARSPAGGGFGPPGERLPRKSGRRLA